MDTGQALEIISRKTKGILDLKIYIYIPKKSPCFYLSSSLASLLAICKGKLAQNEDGNWNAHQVKCSSLIQRPGRNNFLGSRSLRLAPEF